ncbi:hypothetical protein BT93_H1308 [Corymbia citriodora subsp. variegata]|nr:hypothetical protein BT93_H1308 [Corymbia citriodora subsp. variegata]
MFARSGGRERLSLLPFRPSASTGVLPHETQTRIECKACE